MFLLSIIVEENGNYELSESPRDGDGNRYFDQIHTIRFELTLLLFHIFKKYYNDEETKPIPKIVRFRVKRVLHARCSRKIQK